MENNAKKTREVTYKILVDKRVEKQIAALHPTDQKRIIETIDKLPGAASDQDHPPNIKKLAGHPNSWRALIGDIRILFYKDKDRRVLEIYKIGYRGGIY